MESRRFYNVWWRSRQQVWSLVMECDIVKDSGKSRRCVVGWSIVEQLSLRIDSWSKSQHFWRHDQQGEMANMVTEPTWWELVFNGQDGRSFLPKHRRSSAVPTDCPVLKLFLENITHIQINCVPPKKKSYPDIICSPFTNFLYLFSKSKEVQRTISDAINSNEIKKFFIFFNIIGSRAWWKLNSANSISRNWLCFDPGTS